ncbi:MAG: class I SAM-dependent methyltransferase [Nitrososphaerota archaeon]
MKKASKNSTQSKLISYPNIIGLGKEWSDIVDTLSKISGYYRELNRVLSFGKDVEIRREAVKDLSDKPKMVLDLGAGDGSFTEVACNEYPGIELIIMLDVLSEMLSKARKTPNVEKVQGVFEYLPFRGSLFDHVLAAFSLRDARDLEKALAEVSNVLRKSGRLIVVDLGKPDNLLKRCLISFYWVVIAPLHAFLRLGTRGLESIKIMKTLKSYPVTSQLVKIYRRYFHQVMIVEKLMGSAIILKAQK